jgi:hypothetical protein
MSVPVRVIPEDQRAQFAELAPARSSVDEPRCAGAVEAGLYCSRPPNHEGVHVNWQWHRVPPDNRQVPHYPKKYWVRGQ